MPIVSAKCPNCGGEIQLDDSMKSGFCMFCGSKVIVQDAIELGKIKIDGKVSVEGIAGLERMVQNGEQFLELGEYKKAQNVFTRISDEYPEDYRGWWGLIRSKTRNLSVSENYVQDDEPYKRLFDNSLKLAPKEKAEELKQRYYGWQKECERAVNIEKVKYKQGMISYHIYIIDDYEKRIIELGEELKKAHRKIIIGLAIVFLIMVGLYIAIFVYPTWWLLLIIPASILGAIGAFLFLVGDGWSNANDSRDKIKHYKDEIAEKKEEIAKLNVEMAEFNENC